MSVIQKMTGQQEDQGEKMEIFETKTMNTTFYIEISNSEIENWQEIISSLLQYFEREFSRFHTDNELWVFNEEKKNSIIKVSPILFDLLKKGEEYHIKTDGRFSPYMLSILEAQGYNQSFPFVKSSNNMDAVIDYKQERNPLVFHDDFMITKNTEQKIDLGGIAKGYAVEAVSKWLRKNARSRYGIVDGGGDIEVWSDGEKSWRIGIMDPFDEDKEIGSFSLRNGGIATSNIIYRSWVQGGKKKHHLLDGRTGLPVQTDIVQATVIAENCLVAEIGAKICFMDYPATINSVLSKVCKPCRYFLVKSNRELVRGGLS